MEECVDGRMSQLSATLGEVMERYSSQKDMLAEIQALHARLVEDCTSFISLPILCISPDSSHLCLCWVQL